MGKIDVLVEVIGTPDSAASHRPFSAFKAAMESEVEAVRQGERLLADLTGIEVSAEFAPIPMFTEVDDDKPPLALKSFSSRSTSDELTAKSVVVAAQMERSMLDKYTGRANVRVYPNSPLKLFCSCGARTGGLMSVDALAIEKETETLEPFDLASSARGVDCRPFQPGVSIEVIRRLLGVERVWFDGFRGQNIIVGIIDEGINGHAYPVVGGFTRPNHPQPGSAPVTSHGSMCAADVLVAAPAAKLYDYPFIDVPRSGGAMAMFQEVLGQRRLDGTPHVTNNSYGFVGKPPIADYPNHEVYDINHPLHRKVREVVASGCTCLFAAGNCGEECPSSDCHSSGIGAGNSIHASNSLAEVITVAAANARHDRIGYSSQGPGGFEREKPDVTSYSHFFGNFGPGRPAGTAAPFDNGTSAATPVAAGVVALLLSAFPNTAPADIKRALIEGAISIGAPGWDTETGHGVVNAAASYQLLRDP